MFPLNCVKDVSDANFISRDNFEWGFKPLTTWMKITTGIRIDFNKVANNCSVRRIGFFLYSGLLFLSNVARVCLLDAVDFNISSNRTNAYSESKLIAGRIGLMIECYSYNALILLPHLWLFVFSLTNKWKCLWYQFKETQQMNLPFTTYQNIRRKSWILVFILILVRF